MLQHNQIGSSNNKVIAMKKSELQVYSGSRSNRPSRPPPGRTFEVSILNDMGRRRVKNGELDYFIGACNTGAGAALSIAIAIIG